MGAFLRELERHGATERGRRWLYVPYDQLSDELGPLAREAPDELGIVVVESAWKAARRPYHKQKLALLLANQRHFALQQARRGVAVRFVATERSFGEALRSIARELGPLRAMEPAERELRVDLAPLVAGGLLEILPHEGWLTTAAQFAASQPAKDCPITSLYWDFLARKRARLAGNSRMRVPLRALGGLARAPCAPCPRGESRASPPCRGRGTRALIAS
jgi:deoxyribodipyrimidine photolyase-related protein